jgi:hypothetical protein
MKIRILKGVSGYRADGSAYRHPAGSVIVESDYIASDLLKNGLAVIHEEPEAKRPVAYAVAPMVKRSDIIHAVVKRGRKPKRDV